MSEVFDRISLLDRELISGVIDGNIEKVRTMLKSGADPNRSKFKGHSLLDLAMARWKFKIARLLVKFGASTTSSKILQDTILCAIREIDDTFYYFIFKGRRSSTFSDEFSHTAPSRIVRCRPELVETLIAFGNDPQPYIKATAYHGTVENLKQLLNFCVEPPEDLPIGIDMHAKLSLIEQHMSRPVSHRKEIALSTLISAKEKLSKNMLKFAHDEVLNVCIALRPLKIPVYVLFEIVTWLPNYNFFRAFQIVQILEKIRKTMYK